ncbi:MAG: DUF2961 domain-containing protein [Phycisphaerae bacterium]
MSFRTLTLLLLLGVAPLSARAQSARTTQADLFDRMIDLKRLAAPLRGEQSALFAGLAGADEKSRFRGKTSDGWNIAGELDGPGIINRIWCEEPTGLVRIIIDGKIAIEGKLDDLFAGGIEPFGEPFAYLTHKKRGGVSYLPIGFNKRISILMRDNSSSYQIDFVKLPPGNEVEPFTPDLSDAALDALRRVANVMKIGFEEKKLVAGVKTGSGGAEGVIKQNEKLTWEGKSHGTIRAFYVAITDDREPKDPYFLRDVTLRIYTDGQKAPDVEVPLCDYFGSGFDRNASDSLVAGTALALDNPASNQNQGLWFYSYLPIPFADGIKIEIENRNKPKIGLSFFVRTDRSELAPDTMRLRAKFASAIAMKESAFTLLDLESRGRLVGCSLSVDCPRLEWWGRGPHTLRLDGNDKLTMNGTNVQGFFGLSEASAINARALHGATLAKLQGKSSYFRWLLPDAIEFNRSIRLDFADKQTGDAKDVYYSGVVHWYAPAGEHDVKPTAKPLGARPPGLRIAGAIEVEGNIVGEGWGNVLDQKFGDVELSGNKAASISTTNAVTIKLDAPAAGKFMLRVRTHPKRSFERIVVKTAAGKLVGSVEYKRTNDGVLDVGEIDVAKGENQLTVNCTRPAVLDYWLLAPVKAASQPTSNAKP